MKNKKVKLMICDVLNRNGHEFGYYSLNGSKWYNRYNYALRLYGQPLKLSKACAMVKSDCGYKY